MFKYFKKSWNNEKGFTMVELMGVLLVISILVAIAVPVYNNVQTNSANRADQSNRRILQGAGQAAIMTEGIPPGAINWDAGNGENDDEYGWGNYLQEWPVVPNGASETGAYEVTLGADGTVTVTVQ